MIKESIKERVLDYVTEKDLQGDTKLIAELTSMDTAKELMKSVGGMSIHIQSVENLEEPFIRFLQAHFDCKNLDKRNIIHIADRTEKSPKVIRRLLLKMKKELVKL